MAPRGGARTYTGASGEKVVAPDYGKPPQAANQNVSQAEVKANLPPPKQQNKVQSVATIPDGYTVVVGGIDIDSDS